MQPGASHHQNAQPATRRARLFCAVLGLVLLGLVLPACSNPSLERLTGSASTDVTAPDPTAEPAGGTDSVTTGAADAADTASPVPTAVFATDSGDEPTLAPAPTGAFLVARDGAGRAATDGSGAYLLSVYDEPDSAPRTLTYEYPNGSTIEYPLTNPTFFGNDLVLRVVDGVQGDEWIQVQAPVRPNGRTVWVKGEDFTFATTDNRIEVDLADTTLRVYEGDDRLISTRVAFGKIDQPTPLGLSYVNELIPQPLNAGGPIVFNLALFSEIVNDIGGALPAITLHGMSDRGDIGKGVTSGTMRAPSDVIATIAEAIEPGALVIIFDSSEPETDRDAIIAASTEPVTTQP